MLFSEFFKSRGQLSPRQGEDVIEFFAEVKTAVVLFYPHKMLSSIGIQNEFVADFKLSVSLFKLSVIKYAKQRSSCLKPACVVLAVNQDWVRMAGPAIVKPQSFSVEQAVTASHELAAAEPLSGDRKSTRLNSSHTR